MQNIRKIIFFVETPFSKRDYDRFSIEILKANGFDVEVWDFTSFLYPESYKSLKSIIFMFNGYRPFFLKNDALNAIAELTHECFIVCLLAYNLKNYQTYKFISKLKLEYCVHSSNAVPFFEPLSIRSFNNVFKKIRNMKINHLINFFFSRMPSQIFGIKKTDIVLAGGEKSLIGNKLIGHKTKILWGHTFDYDLYLQEQDAPPKNEKAYGVFLDEDVPFHPDYGYMGVQPFSTPEQYYPCLCKFFSIIEQKQDCEIIIAAHPRSKYENMPDFFNGRPVVKGKTVELVKNARFVITHSSTANNFAVLFRKPIIFVTTDSLQQSTQGPWIEKFASCFDKKAINISKPFDFDLDRELAVDNEKYIAYKRNYIKRDGTPELPFWQIVANSLKKMKN